MIMTLKWIGCVIAAAALVASAQEACQYRTSVGLKQ